ALAEGRRIGIADARHLVPVRAARRQRERRPRRVAGEATLGVERVEEREEVVLVGAAAVEEDERSLRLPRGGALEVPELAHERTLQLSRGFVRGVSVGSICSRRCSNAGGRISCSPRCSSGSSVVKPGPIVASSKRTPLGSRKYTERN